MNYITLYLTVCLGGAALAALPLHFHNRNVTSNGLGITGGSPAPIKSVPYQAAIISDSGYLLGSGSIVAKNYILTSGFLVSYYDDLKVRVGSASSSEGGQFIEVEEKIIHEKFNGLYSYDVALLKLSKNIKFGKTAKAIKIASKPPKNGISVTVSGFGSTNSEIQGSNANDLRKGKQNVVVASTCQPSYDYITFDESDTCAFSDDTCPCSYDFGDPIVNKNTLIGYFIGGAYCCASTYPQIYTDVSSINKWVKSHINSQGHDEKENIGHYFGESD